MASGEFSFLLDRLLTVESHCAEKRYLGLAEHKCFLCTGPIGWPLKSHRSVASPVAVPITATGAQSEQDMANSVTRIREVDRIVL